MAVAATSISASDIRLPSSLSSAYISDAFPITSSVMGKTILTEQNLLNISICLKAFFDFKPFRISYFAICDMVRRLCRPIYSAALAFTRLCPLNNSESISVSRRDGGYISIS